MSARNAQQVRHDCHLSLKLRLEIEDRTLASLSRNDHVPGRVRLETPDLGGSKSCLPQGVCDIVGRSKGEDILRKSKARHRLARQEAECEHAIGLEHAPDLACALGQRAPEVDRVDAAHLVELAALKRQGLDLT